jgi:hypothetical protein
VASLTLLPTTADRRADECKPRTGAAAGVAGAAVAVAASGRATATGSALRHTTGRTTDVAYP